MASREGKYMKADGFVYVACGWPLQAATPSGLTPLEGRKVVHLDPKIITEVSPTRAPMGPSVEDPNVL